jgi:hypothetical protein
MVTAEGILFRSDNMKQLGSAAKEVISDSRKLLESARTGLLANLEKEMTYLRTLFDGKMKEFAACANKWLKIDYEHIFGMEFIFGRNGLKKVCGFHHDIMNFLEKSGIIEFANKIVYENGFYKATLRQNGNMVKKTAIFFPAHWSRKKVIETIYEAYENFIKSDATAEIEKGKYLVRGFTNEKVTIEMYITQKGRIITAYPIL